MESIEYFLKKQNFYKCSILVSLVIFLVHKTKLQSLKTYHFYFGHVDYPLQITQEKICSYNSCKGSLIFM